MTNEEKKSGKFIPGSTLKYDPATLTAPKNANFAEVSTVNGSIYVDFGFLEYLVELDRVQGIRNQPMQLVSRVAISSDTCIRLISLLAENLNRLGIHIKLGDINDEEPSA